MDNCRVRSVRVTTGSLGTVGMMEFYKEQKRMQWSPVSQIPNMDPA